MQRTITIIEDNEQIRTSLQTLLLSQNQYKNVYAYGNCEEALKRLHSDQPNMVLMDIDLPGISGIEGTRRVREMQPNCIVIIVSVYDAGEHVFKALCAGASGYIIKNSDCNLILNAIDDAFAGAAPMSATISRMVVESFQKRYDSPLSKRELEILQLISEGMTYTRIANALYISKDTVKTHIKNIYRKLEVTCKEDAIKIASRHRWIGTGSECPDKCPNSL